MDRDERIESLRADLVNLVASQLSPVALRYGLSEVPLEESVKWRPQVLILGNYSSGKSTLINELLGAPIQATGQAPTDDSFTVITYDERAGDGTVQVTEERDGQVLLSDPQYPYARLKRHGQRFAAHFRLKKISSPFLKHLALIDTPGMLDSLAEKDRGYDYQQVIHDLAEIADLILVMFDPHKAGTIRETHASLRETLPQATFEDRVIFVMNRIDECANLPDLLRVYGTLCWNLSQMLGRKDMPPIRLTYGAAQASVPEHLRYLTNERAEIRRQIALAPKYRLDHLASFVETHGSRLAHTLEALVAYAKERRLHLGRLGALGMGFALVVAALFVVAAFPLGGDWTVPSLAFGVAFAAILAAWLLLVLPWGAASFHRKQLAALDRLTPLGNQARRDSWEVACPKVKDFLEKTGGRYKAREVKRDLGLVRNVVDQETRTVRAALNDIATTRYA